MPRLFNFDVERGALSVVVSGTFTEMDFRNGIAATLRDPRFGPDLRVLIDFSGVTQFQIPASALAEFVANRVFSPASRRAFVVSSGFGASFVEFGKLCGAVEQIQVFWKRADAVKWLNEGVPPAKQIT